MKIALVHDYIGEFGGAERVLLALSEMYPDAPIYTALAREGVFLDKLEGKGIITSWAQKIPFFATKLYSPLRFLAPFIWRSFDLSGYDLVITSASWFISRGFKVGKNTKVICYCHTPPRYLYGYETSIDLTRYWPVRIYAAIVNHFLRMYDFSSAQKVDLFIANSENVKARIKKFYRREVKVIYPPVEVKKIQGVQHAAPGKQKEQYFLIVSRLVGGKGIEEAVEAAIKLGFKLKIAGEAGGFSRVRDRVRERGKDNVELLGRVSDEELYRLYAGAQGFIALAKDEDFGMTVVEAQAAGTPVIAYNGGGFRESVVDGVTGLLIDDASVEGIKKALHRFEKTGWDKRKIQENAKRFSRENFEKKIRQEVASILR